uniref:DUF6824 domain-containing protein n=1 Tax=Craspedostauros australis TaxID=1486917 RepID=A0A7S0F790_9STRA|mmetsp:Transcript_9220/g.24889  ORF Transcript_9220/g.24889 Transcript_9220/m.24889 type:complete len:410 (+) Transcript_9220:245-1474(+)|eukprot:CAMPEP_0198112040 /NCGR_PEP_ID=MMETSP1442-20131203/3942_1 /TAXON_ID= /ORGANISM="Craspedostauros australis, Strain CCMP3328" /LENGTH=409 /DNA_ID=CAMNT_0043768683 /DNA_START=209 /DNA_END=1438 /DNA_ORIENTATION=+
MSSIAVMEAKSASAGPKTSRAKTAKRSKVSTKWRPLKPEFEPGPFDVICARGKDAREHVGNRRMRLTVDVSLDRYRAASTKHEKSNIVWHIVDTVRAQSPEGGFVKFANGGWYEVGDHWAREKIGQSFRDRLHMDYKSSSRAKSVRKRMANTPGPLEIQQNAGEELNEHMLKVSQNLFSSDENEITRMLVQANKAMLKDMKEEDNVKMPATPAVQDTYVPPPIDLNRDVSNLFAAPPHMPSAPTPVAVPSASAAAAVEPIRMGALNMNKGSFNTKQQQQRPQQQEMMTQSVTSSGLLQMPMLRSSFSKTIADHVSQEQQQQQPQANNTPLNFGALAAFAALTSHHTKQHQFAGAFDDNMFAPLPLDGKQHQRSSLDSQQVAQLFGEPSTGDLLGDGLLNDDILSDIEEV